MQLPLKLPYDLMLTKWAQILNPLLGNLITQGVFISAPLQSGNNVINHTLGRQQQGWIITDITTAASIYRSAPFNSLTLSLNSSAATSVNLYIF